MPTEGALVRILMHPLPGFCIFKQRIRNATARSIVPRTYKDLFGLYSLLDLLCMGFVSCFLVFEFRFVSFSFVCPSVFDFAGF